MKLFLISIFLLALAPACAYGQRPVKGSWIFVNDALFGDLVVQVVFRDHGKGIVYGGTPGILPLSYREKGNYFSAAFEGVGVFPDGASVTIVFRGTKIDDNTISGIAIVIEDYPDPINPINAFTLPFNGKRVN
jgi:hypothetical protein